MCAKAKKLDEMARNILIRRRSIIVSELRETISHLENGERCDEQRSHQKTTETKRDHTKVSV